MNTVAMGRLNCTVYHHSLVKKNFFLHFNAQRINICEPNKLFSIYLFIKVSIYLFSGGCVSHEIIKLITRQYKPVNNSFVFNAINCSTETFTL